MSLGGIAFGTVLLIVLTTAGCDQGTVPAKGQVMIEGKPVSGGRLSLIPSGGGPRAFSLVDEQGQFALRVAGGVTGAYPGSYQVSFQQPLDAQKHKSIARELAGELTVDDVKLIFRGPPDKPLVIPDSGDEQLVIDIRLEQGWKRRLVE